MLNIHKDVCVYPAVCICIAYIYIYICTQSHMPCHISTDDLHLHIVYTCTDLYTWRNDGLTQSPFASDCALQVFSCIQFGDTCVHMFIGAFGSICVCRLCRYRYALVDVPIFIQLHDRTTLNLDRRQTAILTACW